MTRPFWQEKTLAEMTEEEWESLCDGCGRCCLHKLEDEDTGVISYTNVGCRLLGLGSGRCTRYHDRQRFVPDCVRLRPELVGSLRWLPSTCAYRLIHEGRDLLPWHPLVSGDDSSVHAAGVSVRGRAIAERQAGPLDHHIVLWPE